MELTIDHIEIYTPMAKVIAYWHCNALGFTMEACMEGDGNSSGKTSYLLSSNNIRLVLTSSYPTSNQPVNNEVAAFLASSHYGVKRIALATDTLKATFEKAVSLGGIPIKAPVVTEDEFGAFEEASIKLYDQSEITFIDRKMYNGVFKPGFSRFKKTHPQQNMLLNIDHIASEVRINEMKFWTNYLTRVLGTNLVQTIESSIENQSGLLLNINQSVNKELVFVIAEPESLYKSSKVQKNVELYGPGIHHLAFTTDDMVKTTETMLGNGVEFVKFPASYYQMLRQQEDLQEFDIDRLEKYGILIDKEDNQYLLQKFIKPISDRPFFIYEIVQRVNGYNGFALKNINVLKKAEELEIMAAANKEKHSQR